MENRRKYLVLIAIGTLMILFGNTVYLWSKLDRLEDELRNVRGSVSAISFNDGGMEYRLMEEIRKGTSFLDSSETKLNLESGRLLLDVSIVPKKVQEGDRFFIISGKEKVEAVQRNDVLYTASVPMNTKEGMELFALLETAEGTLREKLPEVYLDQYLSLELRSMVLSASKDLEITLEAMTEESKTYLETLKDLHVTVYDGMDKEVMELPVEELSKGSEELDPPYGYASKSFLVRLPASLNEMDSYMVRAKLKNYGITLVSDLIYQYSKDGVEMEGGSSHGFQISFEE